jgi:hypothetical protein
MQEQLDVLLDRIAQIIVAEVSDDELALLLLAQIDEAAAPETFEQPRGSDGLAEGSSEDGHDEHPGLKLLE